MMPRKGQWIKPDGNMSFVLPHNGENFELEELRGYVGGHIEIVNLTNDTILVVNEEGKLEGLPPNIIGTGLFRTAFPQTRDYIVGNVLYCHKTLVK